MQHITDEPPIPDGLVEKVTAARERLRSFDSAHVHLPDYEERMREQLRLMKVDLGAEVVALAALFRYGELSAECARLAILNASR